MGSPGEMITIVRPILREARYFATMVLKAALVFYFPLAVIVTLLCFPYDTDPSRHPRATSLATDPANAAAAGEVHSAEYYAAVYERGGGCQRGLDYETTAKAAAEQFRIEDQVRAFVADYHLEDRRILEVGSGRGYLQDVVKDYTGLDLSPNVAHRYHKPFVVGSATNMPFPDSSFDAIWSVWVLEHIAAPERALSEMRRVIRPGGYLFLFAAWNCVPWASGGFAVRPYSDFNWRGKLVKASLPLRQSVFFDLLHRPLTRAVRWAQYEAAGTRAALRFRALEPNYDVYWQADADAAISLDSFEAFLWFRAQGDQCVDCGSIVRELPRERNPLIIRILK